MQREATGEFLGTALMVCGGCGSVALGAEHGLISLSFGAVVTLAILMFGPFSGAHINPAVSVAFWRDGQLEGRLVPVYLLAQFLGGVAGAVVVGGAAPTTLEPSLTLLEGFAVEVVITVVLMTSILWIVQRTSSRPHVAVWVGATVGVLAFFGGSTHGRKHEPCPHLRSRCTQRVVGNPSLLLRCDDVGCVVGVRRQTAFLSR